MATPISRREFLAASASSVIASASAVHANSWAATPGEPSQEKVVDPGGIFWILTVPNPSFHEQLAAKELERGIRKLRFSQQQRRGFVSGPVTDKKDFLFEIRTEPGRFKHPEAFEVALHNAGQNQPSTLVKLTGATPLAALYAVFDFLERQGAFFGLDGEVYPLEPRLSLNLPPSGQPWLGMPRFSSRGLVPWPDFLNCISVFNAEDHRAYLEAMLRMRFNTLGIHVYGQSNYWVESFLSFEYGPTGHIAFTDTTATNRWGYVPQRTSRFGMGASQFYDGEVFGSDATRLARDTWEAEELAQQLWRDAFQYAGKLGIRTGVGFEPYQIPGEILQSAPPEARLDPESETHARPRLDPESVAARDILEIRLGRLLETYPSVDYVWLFEDEGMSWRSHKNKTPLSVTPFKTAHDFLRRHAPKKRMVISGWGGVARHFEDFNRRLPEDIIFTGLSDMLGWDPVNEAYGKLGGRERWPILWVEDDPSMWFPQFHVNRFQRDMKLAEEYGCQGVLGIHWRHKITDPTAGYQSEASWDKSLSPATFYARYGKALARSPRGEKLGQILESTDRERKILSTFSGEYQNGHAVTNEFAGDYEEGFVFWKGSEIPPSLMQTQKEVANALLELTLQSSSPEERERMEYISKHVEMLVPYATAWVASAQLNKLLMKAVELKKADKADEARNLIKTEGVELWYPLGSAAREVLLNFQHIVSTRNDLGSLASMHNKLERLTLFRLPASMKEFLGELPEQLRKAQTDLAKPDPNASTRIFLPTRPTILLKGETVRLSAVAPGADAVTGIVLFTRAWGETRWFQKKMQLAGRRTYTAQLGPFDPKAGLVDYYVEAEISRESKAASLTAPSEAPKDTYTLTLV